MLVANLCLASRSASIAGIRPRHLPIFLIARNLAPALITGNPFVIKPSEESPINASIAEPYRAAD